MDLAALLDFICLGIGRLDLLASVELSEDPGLSDGGEPDIGLLAPQPDQSASTGSSITGTSLNLSAHELCKGPEGSGSHILWLSAFPLASSGMGESVITNVLWPSQRLRRGACDLVPKRTRAQLLGKRVGGNLQCSGGVKTPQ